jgi:phosphatidate cytidylyltransferase
MLDESPTVFSWLGLALLTVALLASALGRARFRSPPYLRYLWALLLLLSVADWISFQLAVWLFAVFSFLALREYFSLVDIRLQDRWGILGAYLSIPFMTYFIAINWYGMFIISIPVYTFLVIPLLVALGGGKSQGTVFSIGAIDLGLFLFAYCMGHIGYLAFFSVRIAMLLVLGVAYGDLIWRRCASCTLLLRYLIAAMGTAVFALLITGWTSIPWIHSLALGFLIPFLVFCGNFTLRVVEEDLGVEPERLVAGRGLVLDSLKAYLYAAPITFHYLRWFLHWGDL